MVWSLGSLDTWLPDNAPDMPMPQLLDVAYQAVLGVGALKQNKIVHRDIAARNFLIGWPHYLCVCCITCVSPMQVLLSPLVRLFPLRKGSMGAAWR